MDVQTEIRGNAVLARLSGEIDLAGADNLRNSLESALDDNLGARHLIVNFSDVTYIDSSGLGVLLGRYKRVTRNGGKVFIVGAVPQVRKILEMSGLLHIMPECSSEKDALKHAG
jgi:stage II sporulation protein AA (anti-sigma F factor antagonist)